MFPNLKINQFQEYSTTTDSSRLLDPLISLFTISTITWPQSSTPEGQSWTRGSTGELVQTLQQKYSFALSTGSVRRLQEALIPALLQLKGYIHSYSLPPTVVLDVVVVVEAALVVVPFLVPVTNSIWEGETHGRKRRR